MYDVLIQDPVPCLRPYLASDEVTGEQTLRIADNRHDLVWACFQFGGSIKIFQPKKAFFIQAVILVLGQEIVFIPKPDTCIEFLETLSVSPWVELRLQYAAVIESPEVIGAHPEMQKPQVRVRVSYMNAS